MNRVNPRLSASLPDFARAFANGLVANGHVVLLVLVCIGVSYMGRDLIGLAKFIDQPDQPEFLEEIDLTSIALYRKGRAETFREASDERINLHYMCSFAEFRKGNEETCVSLDRFVAEAISRD